MKKQFFIISMFIFIIFAVIGCSAKQESKIISLDFNEVKVEQEIKPIKSELITGIIKEYDIDNGKYFVFEKSDNEEDYYYYGGYKTNEIIYEIGKVTNKGYKKEGFDIQKTELFNKELICIDGTFGANCVRSNYYILEEGKPKNILSIDGHVTEVDLDKDGIKEIVTTYGTPGPYTIIYKYENDKFFAADINKLLNARYVSFHNEEIPYFEALCKDKDKPICLKYQKQGLELIK